MLIDPVKMKSARERCALTQEALAHQARVNVRTVQRAESGQPVHAETVAELAAVLGVPAAQIITHGPQKEAEVLETEAEEGPTQVVKRIDRAETVISTLERSVMAVLACTAEPNKETMPALRELIQCLEPLIGDPWDVENSTPLRFESLLDRLEAVSRLNSALADIEKLGMALFMATSTEYVKVPRRVEEGFMAVRTSQTAEYSRAARFLIADYTSERMRVPADAVWPLEIEPNPYDDDIPF
ncbi:helix-turn-helix domain-containing protein [Qipengyuania aquimaris]|uniref:Helix-turn-helix transcriptional regulator n=1 Tax=Qipengyuania aquimaris TaxID=255984 RepID=A0A9Q3S2F5_9SPHN|nr:helix-turn-helix transcriptional regulator [Qipengyuania aquimaris]MBY6218721.1 helix-turn-helix transcriptional regulator [Qipengyuania aquimaris]